MNKDFVPGFRDTKVTLKRVKEYSGSWLESTSTMFFEGKPSREQITDEICRKLSINGNVIVNADFDISEVTLQDYANFCHNG